MYERGREKDSNTVNNPYDNVNMPLKPLRCRVCFGNIQCLEDLRMNSPECIFGVGNTHKVYFWTISETAASSLSP